MTFLERLSTLLGKQYLFKDTNGYYNKYNSRRITEEEAENWIFNMLIEEFEDLNSFKGYNNE